MNDIKHTILLVDDHPVFRRGMRSLLEDEEDIRVVGEAGDGKSALTLMRNLSPDIIIMDVTMPELNGIETTKRILSEYPDMIVVALSIHAEKQFVHDMLQAGATGYMLKDSGSEELIKGIRSIIAGQGYLSPAITGLVVSQFRKAVALEHHHEADYEILETKFHVPILPDNYVARPRLLKRLEMNCRLSVQCIIAPAGYGKTTLVSDWITQHDWPYAWVSLDDYDNDFRKFITCVVQAIEVIFPNALAKSSALLKAASMPPIQVLATTLSNELNMIRENFTLVLDDFHVIKEKSVHDLFSELFRHPISVMHIIIVSRTDPFLPLSKLRAQNHLAEIRLNGLAFTEGETAAFLKIIFDRDIEQSVSCSWNKKTEGWITGLRLAALAICHKEDLDHLLREAHGSGYYIKEFLFNEVWEIQPENIRRHIATVSILQRFNASLLDVLCPYRNEGCELNGWYIINRLKKNNLFLVPLDNDGQWFRFHHLFQELLQGQLKRTCSDEEIDELHYKAGNWFAENGLFEEAIQHFLAADRPDRAGELVAELGHTLIDQERVVDLDTFLRKLPQEVIDNNPLLLIYEAWLSRVNLLVPKIGESLKRAEEILQRDPPSKAMSDIIWGYLQTIRSYERYCMLDHEKALSSANLALKIMPLDFPYMRAFASIIHAAVLQMTGRYQEALSVMKSAQRDPGLQRKHNQAILLAGLSPICMLEADEFMLQKTASRLLQLGKDTDLSVYRSWGRLYLACSYYLQDDLEQAEHMLASHLEDRHLMYPDVVIDGAVILSLCHQQQGRPQEACEVADLLNRHALETGHDGLLSAAHALHAELALCQGRHHEAIAWAEAFESRKLHAHYFFFLPELTLVKVLIVQDTADSCQRAQSLLLDLEKFSRSTSNRSVLIPTLLLQAIVLYTHDRSASLAKATESISLAQTGGGLRFFLDLGSQLKHILLHLRENAALKGLVERLITGINNHAQGAQHFPSSAYPKLECLTDPLTDREQEILNQLVQGKSNREIGENLFISIDTVKSHLKRIFHKLDVKSRLQAVAKATDLGILDTKSASPGKQG
ncbi:response regulator [Desulforhopalus sp. 52FAK]